MVFRIHFELEDGVWDSVVISGDTIDEIRELTKIHLELKRGKNPWSEQIE